MEQESKLPKKCPSCEHRLQVKRLHCSNCKTEIEGLFTLPALIQLPEEDQIFILEFVTSGGSLKKMGSKMGKSYAVVRNKLDDIIEKLKSHEL